MAEEATYQPLMEVGAPDISPYRRGNTGIDYVTTLDSGRPGPHVAINALTHGNEVCGAHALCFLFEHDVRPLRGRLTLSFANVDAFKRFDPENPFASRFVDEDFNRLWSRDVLDGTRESRELARAREFRPMVEDADSLLDLHSMYFPAPALLIAGPREKSRRLATAMGFPSYVVADQGHKAGRRMRDFGAFDDPESPRRAMLVECGQHWARNSVEVAIATSLVFLREMDIVDGALIAEHLPAERTMPQTEIEVSGPVTVSSQHFRFVEDYRGFEIIKSAGTVIAHDGGKEIVTPYDDCVLVMPVANSRAKPGHTAVRLGRIVS